MELLIRIKIFLFCAFLSSTVAPKPEERLTVDEFSQQVDEKIALLKRAKYNSAEVFESNVLRYKSFVDRILDNKDSSNFNEKDIFTYFGKISKNCKSLDKTYCFEDIQIYMNGENIFTQNYSRKLKKKLVEIRKKGYKCGKSTKVGHESCMIEVQNDLAKLLRENKVLRGESDLITPMITGKILMLYKECISEVKK